MRALKPYALVLTVAVAACERDPIGIERVTGPQQTVTPSAVNGMIAFHSQRDGSNGEIYVMNADGSGQTRLTTHPAIDHAPDWSPDGTKLAFSSTRDVACCHEIYVMNADGSGVVRLTNNSTRDDHPAWSPDGSKIAFVSGPDFRGHIWVMNADGSGKVQLTSGSGEEIEPAWSPDGSRIAFRTHDRNGNGEIYVMNADGTNPVRLTNSAGHNRSPSWSPDGSRIAFSASRGGNHDIYVINPDGSGETRLTTHAAGDADPDWSPDGRRLVFMSTRDGNGEIYVMNADGSGQTRLTFTAAAELLPSWGAAPVTTIPVVIDIKPGSDENPVNVKERNGVIPVAVYSTADFDATSIVWSTVRFGPGRATETHRRGHIEDVNRDGRADLLLHFRVGESGIACGDTKATLTGTTTGGKDVEGSDAIVTRGCGNGG